jgi:hypothetical protein
MVTSGSRAEVHTERGIEEARLPSQTLLGMSADW